LEEHNTAREMREFTSRGIPWQKFLVFENLTSQEAYLLEKKLKSMRSKRYYHNLKAYTELRDKVLLEIRSLVQPR
jgi:precorrin-6B methylase 1